MPPGTDFRTAEIGKPVALVNILFQIKTAKLDWLAQFVRDNLAAETLPGGYTNIIGEADKNRVLSENRVKAIHRYLVGRGIAPSRIRLGWYGDIRPLLADKSLSGDTRSANRRVEITTLKK